MVLADPYRMEPDFLGTDRLVDHLGDKPVGGARVVSEWLSLDVK